MEGDAVMGPWGCGRVIGKREDRVHGRYIGDGGEDRGSGNVWRD
jgi:hypothetical protein